MQLELLMRSASLSQMGSVMGNLMSQVDRAVVSGGLVRQSLDAVKIKFMCYATFTLIRLWVKEIILCNVDGLHSIS